MIGIYKITNELNNKCYIGQSIDIETRWLQHIHEGKRGTNKGKLYPAMYHDGIENFIFEVIEECPLEQEKLDERERYWIEYYNSYEEGYNSTRGGQNENSWIYNPELIRQLWDEGYPTGKIAQIVGCGSTTVNNRLQGYKDFNTFTSHQRSCGIKSHILRNVGYKLVGKQDLYFSEIMAVHQYSIDGEYIASYPSLSAAARAVSNGNPGSECNISRIFKGTTNQKLAYGFQWSKEKVDKLPPVPAHNAKLVRCIETGQIFHSTVEAAHWCGLKSKSGVRECCAGILKSSGKHPETGEKLHWEYVE